MWDTTSDIVDSILFQKSSQIGIKTTSPAATLDVNGKSDVRDTLTLFPKGTDSTLAVNGTNFKVDQTGKVTFISGQTFPGTGTVTSVGLSAPSSDFTVSGSPVTKSGTLNLKWSVAPTNANTANAIVKRDAAGDFMADTITANGRMVALANTGNGNAISGAIYGGANSSTGAVWGVEGEQFSSDPGASGVVGRGHNGGVGVTGLNDAAGGIGVSGSATNGIGFYTDSNVQQARTMGGWVKAMVLLGPFAIPNGLIGACFNSTLSSSATAPPCGFTWSKPGTGDYIIDFGFEVDDRFFSVTGTPFNGNTLSTMCAHSLLQGESAEHVRIHLHQLRWKLPLVMSPQRLILRFT